MKNETTGGAITPIAYFVTIVLFTIVAGSFGLLITTYRKIQEADAALAEYPFPSALVIGYAFGKWLTWGM